MKLLGELGRVGGLLSTCFAIGWLLLSQVDSSSRFRLSELTAASSDDPCICIVNLDWSDDGSRLISHARGDIDAGQSVVLHTFGSSARSKPLRNHDDHIWNVCGFRDGQSVLLCGRHSGARVCNCQGHEQALLMEFAPRENVVASAVSMDGTHAAVAIDDRIMHVAIHGNEPATTLRAPECAIVELVYSDDGRRLVVADSGGTIAIWDLTSRRVVRRWRAHSGPVKGVAIIPGSGKLISAGLDGHVCIWDESGDLRQRCVADPMGVLAIAVSSDGLRFATAGLGKTVTIWDLNRFAPIADLGGQRAPVYALAFGAMGKQLASAGQEGVIRIWDVSESRETVSIDLRTHSGEG